MSKKIPKLPTNEELKEADNQISILVFSKGEMVNGDPYWAYTMVPPSKYIAMKEAEVSGQGFDLEEFGKIITYGIGANDPPEEVVKEMQEKYGANAEFEKYAVEAYLELQQQTNTEESSSGDDNNNSGGQSFVDRLLKKKPK